MPLASPRSLKIEMELTPSGRSVAVIVTTSSGEATQAKTYATVSIDQLYLRVSELAGNWLRPLCTQLEDAARKHRSTTQQPKENTDNVR